MGCSMLFNTE